MDKIIEEGHSMIKITEVILGGQNFRDGYRGNFRHDNLEKLEVGLETDSIQLNLGGMIVVAVDKDQVQE